MVVQPIDTSFGSFTGLGFVSLPADVSIVFSFSPMLDSRYEIVLRFSSVVSAIE